MGYNTYTTSDLIDDVLLLGHVPLGNNTFTPAKILRLAELELQTPIAKQILSTRGGYYLTYLDYEINPQGLYSIPANAVAGALANVELVQQTTVIQVNQIEESEQFATDSPTATSYGFFMRGNFVKILPTPNIGVARLWFFRRTSKLIGTSAASQVQAIAGNIITVGSIPSTFSVGALLDALGDQPPFNILAEDLEITDITGTDITFAEPIVDLEVGDWLALHDQTPVPQIPVEFRVLLAQRVVCKVYELQGYLEKLAAAKKILGDYEEATFTLITPRVKSQTKIINPINGGFLSGNANRITNFPAGRES